MSTDRGDENNKRRRELLKTYYGINNDTENNETKTRKSICDIDDPNFDSDVYLKTLLKQKNLSELVDKEQQMVKSIRELDSDMQMLVYENYNKFISATDTIRKMKSGLLKMEDEMETLSSRMAKITHFSSSITSTLHDRRQQITKLSGVHTLLKKLQFLFNLPNKLQSCVDQGHYSQAVRYYIKARRVLHQYQHTPSLHGIQSECNVIIQTLVSKLRLQFSNTNSDSKQMVECVGLLMQLNEPADMLCEQFLSHAAGTIEANLSDLELQLKLWQNLVSKTAISTAQDTDLVNAMDILEFIDLGSNGFLSNLSLVIASYNDLFLNRQEDVQLDDIASKRLVLFVDGVMGRYIELVRKRVLFERSPGDCSIQVRALDRFYRRLQALCKLISGIDLSKMSIDLISQAAKDRVQLCLQHLQAFYNDRLTDIRQSLASSSGPNISSNHLADTTSMGVVNGQGGLGLVDLVKRLHTSLMEQVKTALNNLQAFIEPTMTFTMKQSYRNKFCLEVRDGLVSSFFNYVVNTSLDFTSQMDEKSNISFNILLVTSSLCHHLCLSSIEDIFSITDEQFKILHSYSGQQHQKQLAVLTSSSAAEAKTAAQLLLNHYVKLQGSTISQMLRKSVETRDCLSSIEPRSVKSVMKRVVEDITAIDKSISQVYEEGSKTERLSDSTARRSMASRLFSGGPAGRSNWSYAHSSVDNSLMNNIQKLFVEKIEIFSAVNFNKMSIMTGIIKICLKTLMECVRQKTFGRYALQQVQVDCHYLDLYLWNFVQDENLVHMLLDEIISSTLHRCLDPVPMEPSVVDLICERG